MISAQVFGAAVAAVGMYLSGWIAAVLAYATYQVAIVVVNAGIVAFIGPLIADRDVNPIVVFQAAKWLLAIGMAAGLWWLLR